MNRTVYIDIDDTIWDAEGRVLQTLAEKYGINKTREEVTYWGCYADWLNNDDNWFDMAFGDALDPAQVKERELFPNVARVLEILHDNEINLHFISHNPKPNKMVTPVHEWLLDKLPGLAFSLTIFGARNDKVKFMQNDPSAWAIVEDKYTTLASAAKAGYVAFGKVREYNRLDIAENPAILPFEDWNEFGKMFYKRLMFGDRVLHAVG